MNVLLFYQHVLKCPSPFSPFCRTSWQVLGENEKMWDPFVLFPQSVPIVHLHNKQNPCVSFSGLNALRTHAAGTLHQTNWLTDQSDGKWRNCNRSSCFTRVHFHSCTVTFQISSTALIDCVWYFQKLIPFMIRDQGSVTSHLQCFQSFHLSRVIHNNSLSFSFTLNKQTYISSTLPLLINILIPDYRRGETAKIQQFNQL